MTIPVSAGPLGPEKGMGRLFGSAAGRRSNAQDAARSRTARALGTGGQDLTIQGTSVEDVSITGTIKHDAKGGDGVLARLVSGRTGAVASWTVARMEVESKLSGLEVKAGETLDFVVQCRADNNSDSFAWSPTVQMADETWSALSQFGPVEKVPTPLSAWEKYAHVLLQSNEFMFVD